MKPRLTFLSLFLLIAFAASAQNANHLLPKDSVVHYYSNGSISVIEMPWVDGQRDVQFFDLDGNLTYSIEEARLSYQVSVGLSFHENGAVKEASVFTNPGASRFMYSAIISFSTTNEPEVRISKKTPALTIADAAGDKYFWNKEKKQWVKQEVVGCQPVQPSKN